MLLSFLPTPHFALRQLGSTSDTQVSAYRSTTGPTEGEIIVRVKCWVSALLGRLQELVLTCYKVYRQTVSQ